MPRNYTPTPVRNLVGYSFGRLNVIAFSHMEPKHRSAWTCRCDCGNTVVVARSSLVAGNTRSCGCLRQETCRKTGQANRKTP